MISQSTTVYALCNSDGICGFMFAFFNLRQPAVKGHGKDEEPKCLDSHFFFRGGASLKILSGGHVIRFASYFTLTCKVFRAFF